MSVLLGTKLTPPAGARMPVARTRLVDRLVRERPRRLTLLDAPPGWGKTTLLAEWVAAEAETRHFAWFTVDRSDNDAVRFWSYAIAALRSVAPEIGDDAETSLGVSGTGPRDLVLPKLINELAARDDEIVLVLEDYHLIENADVHADLEFLLDHLPPTLELAIATRIDPPLPLARMRARGELLELRAFELAFTREETGALLDGVLGESLPPADVERLVARTEGWAAGLYLAALSLAGRADRTGFVEELAGAGRHIVDYLGGEVLDALDADTRTFLLRTSILDRLTGPLCDAVTGGADGAMRLIDIERANLFLVSLDDSRDWYRYHHLFGDLLRHELMHVDGAAVPELHRRAARWLAEAGSVDDAIRHAGAALDVPLASQLVRANWRAAFNRGELTTVDRWLDELPDTTVEADPDLSLARAWVAMDRGRLTEAERWLEHATRGGSGESTVLHAVLCFKLGKVAHARRVAEEALTVADEAAPLGLGVAHCVLGIGDYYLGAGEAAAPALREAVRLSVRSENTLGRVYALGYLALVQLDAGNDDAARFAVDDALQVAVGPPITEHFTFATVLLADGRLRSDADAIDQALALARRGGAPLEIAAVQLAIGELRRDPATLREARLTIEQCEEPGALPERIETAELALRGRRSGPRRAIAGDLSERELAVLRLMPSSSSLREIGVSLYLSQNTIKTHTRSIYRKLGATTRDEAIARGRELGLL